jgi:hypothetical protein
MKIIQIGPYCSKGVPDWYDRVLNVWPIVLIVKWYRYKRLGINLTKAFRKSVARVKKTKKNIEQLNEEALKGNGFSVGPKVTPRPVSEGFIEALENAGARPELIRKLRKDRNNENKGN